MNVSITDMAPTSVQRELVRLIEDAEPEGPRFHGTTALAARIWIAARIHVLEEACDDDDGEGTGHAHVRI